MRGLVVFAAVALVWPAPVLFGQEAADAPRFLREVAPVLAKHCVRCHGSEAQESGLRLDLAASILEGGIGGKVVVPNNSSASRLIRIIRGEDEVVERMPPEGPPLSGEAITSIAAWIDAGARIPAQQRPITVGADHWSLRPPQRPTLPALRDRSWSRNAVDDFVLARLEAVDLVPSEQAARSTLLRRVSLDLVGLPPTLDEIDAFLADTRADAYERLVDRLLASPAYGERWGRHWLDLARYADSNGFTRDFGREIWKYRDWVIAALNDGMPFDQFTIEQFAGDMLPAPTLDQLVATGFHRNTLINEEGGTDPEQFRVDAVADRVATTGVVYLGLTLECARCHAHKYDPISQRDYYQLFALLNSCDEPTIDAPAAWQVDQGIVARRDAIRREIAEKERQLAEQQEALTRHQLQWEATITPEFRRTLPGPTQAAIDKQLEQRDEAQKKLVAELYKTTEVARNAFPLVREIAELRDRQPAIPTTMVLQELPEPRVTHIHRRGNFLEPGDRVEPNVPAVLRPVTQGSRVATRLDFARWLVDPAGPLTPRVIVNRYWQRFFGRGLVETENDFGTQGVPPTHPQLLDWLAHEFVASGWDVKAVHRLIVTSATYRQASRHRAELAAVDPSNRLLARQSRLRLEAEAIRDACLTAGQLLTRTIGGPSVFPPQPEGVFAFTQDPKPWNTATGGDRYRRGMYTFFWRSSPFPALTVFDAPDANVTCTRRVRSNTPLQSLTLANGTQFIECARALGRELVRLECLTDVERLERMFRQCLARAPSAAEAARLRDLIAAQRQAFKDDPSASTAMVGGQTRQAGDVELAAWTAVARVLMNLDEFITRE